MMVPEIGEKSSMAGRVNERVKTEEKEGEKAAG
jgi:hypothetical protein